MQIRFTQHAEEKFYVLMRHGWNISREKVEETVQNSVVLDHSRRPLVIAQSSLDERHVLRVVYKQDEGVAVVITFYPGRKSQYE